MHLDGHTDFRHPGNSGQCASPAGEDLAAAVGRHWPRSPAWTGSARTSRPATSTSQLTGLLAGLAPGAAGAQVTVFDPDLDPDGDHAGLLTAILAEGPRDLGAELTAPPF